MRSLEEEGRVQIVKKKIIAAIVTATLLITASSDTANYGEKLWWRSYSMLNADGTPKIWQEEK